MNLNVVCVFVFAFSCLPSSPEPFLLGQRRDTELQEKKRHRVPRHICRSAPRSCFVSEVSNGVLQGLASPKTSSLNVSNSRNVSKTSGIVPVGFSPLKPFVLKVLFRALVLADTGPAFPRPLRVLKMLRGCGVKLGAVTPRAVPIPGVARRACGCLLAPGGSRSPSGSQISLSTGTQSQSLVQIWG